MVRFRHLFPVLMIFGWMAVTLWSVRAVGYQTYNPPEETDGCFQCHSSFAGMGELHTLHVGVGRMIDQVTGACFYCHQSIGDNPVIGSSGVDPNFGCNGCHTGIGLRNHHISNPLVGGDGFSRRCNACHTDPTPDPEDTIPSYYGRANIFVTNPCARDTASGGEDWNEDGVGLDNDGDLLWDQDDPDCESTPVAATTWGMIRTLYK